MTTSQKNEQHFILLARRLRDTGIPFMWIKVGVPL